MGFFGMGVGEILLILAVVLIIWGPGRLPEITRTIGKTVRAFRKVTSDLTTTVSKELSVEDESHSSQLKASRDDKTKVSSDRDAAESSGAGMTSPRD